MHLDPTLSKKILAWCDNSKRDLPWRVSKKSPKKLYYRLLSEFMLQQTQVKTVIPYYKRWLKRYPTLQSAAEARTDSLLKLWEGLGYYQRCRNFHRALKIVVTNYKGKVPNSFNHFIDFNL